MVPSLSGSLLAATLLLGQSAPNTSYVQQGNGKTTTINADGTTTTTPQRAPLFSWFSRDDRPVISKVQGWFGRKEQKEPPTSTPAYVAPSSNPTYEGTPTAFPKVAPTTPTPLDFPKRMPNATTPAPMPKELPQSAAPPVSKSVQQMALQTPAPNRKSPISPKLAEKIGRDEKFEWITGQLEIENGAYVLYYATPETVDLYHGRIVLQPQQVDLNQFQRGDLVSVRGDVMQRKTPQGAVPVYRVSDAQMIERAKS